MNFKTINDKYRSVPFWSWNEKLDTDETRRQVNAMYRAGIGGFFMHARGGLQTEYMGKEWFDNVDAAATEAQKCGMKAWAYDENGWPSGFGNGKVNGLGIDYQQKYLRMEDSRVHTDTAIAKCGEHWFYYEVNPFYTDTLDKKVVKEFIDCSYKPYYEKYKDSIEGFFTDEPQISRNGIPWSFVFEKEYKNRYNENIFDILESLFLPVGEYKNARVKFWKMVTDLFSEAYMKQIYEQCEEWGLKLTGHLALEESLISQIPTSGACMPHYEYMHIPGMDWLGKRTYDCLTVRQVSSVAEQLGKKYVLAETFGLTGHNVSFSELKGIYEWQAVRGINLLCQHLEGYSIRGMRKHDYPPAMYYQQPWWNEYKKFNDAISRESMLLGEGVMCADILVIHPMTTAWTLYSGETEEIAKEDTALYDLNERFIQVITALEKKHRCFHLGDETIIERHAYVKDGKLVIGKQSYSYVVCDCCEELLPTTRTLLDEFAKQGGRIAAACDISENDVVDSEDITYTKRKYDDFTLHFFVNTSERCINTNINISGDIIDIYTGNASVFGGKHCFEAWGSLMLAERRDFVRPMKAENETVVYPDGEFTIIEASENAVTLDCCDYYFDGELQEKNGFVLNICERANALERPVDIHWEYHINISEIPESLYLVCETPEKFKITVNGKEMTEKDCGYYRDISFRKFNILDYAAEGLNTISFDCTFSQQKEVYQKLKNAWCFESEKNNLVYDTEIEAIYLTGSFSVETSGQWKNVHKDVDCYSGDFTISGPRKKIHLKNIEKQGYPFFCGELTVEGKINIDGENPVLYFDRKGVNVVKVCINGRERVLLTESKLFLNEFGVKGIAPVKITMINNLRNLLGPHHLKDEPRNLPIGPWTFYKEKCIWNPKEEFEWSKDYNFAVFGI